MSTLLSPFVGLTPYDERSMRYFCGRDLEVDLVTANISTTRLTVFYGLSGSGKSSVLKAGLIPWLHAQPRNEKKGALAMPFRHIPVLMREEWSQDPWASLCKGVQQALARWPAFKSLRFPQDWLSIEPEAATHSSETDSETEVTTQSSGATTSINTGAAPLPAPRLALVLDQFEDLFIQHPEIVVTPSATLLDLAAQWRGGKMPMESKPGLLLVSCLIALLNDPHSPVNVIFSLREDTLASLDVFKGLIPNLFGSMLRVDSLDGAGVRKVITDSISRWNEDHGTKYEVEASLIDEILADKSLWIRMFVKTGSQGPRYETPFLQIVLNHLWQVDILGGKKGMTRDTFITAGKADGIRKKFVDDQLRCHLQDGSPRQRWFLEASRYLVSRTQKFPWRISDLIEAMRPGLERSNMQLLPTVNDMVQMMSQFAEARITRRLADDGFKADENDARFEIAHDALAGDIYRWRVEKMAIIEADEEARQRIEQLAAEARTQEEIRKNTKKAVEKLVSRLKVLGWVFGIVVVLAAVVVGVSWYQVDRMQQESAEARKKLDEAQRESADAKTKRAEAETAMKEALDAKEQASNTAQKLEAEARQNRVILEDFRHKLEVAEKQLNDQKSSLAEALVNFKKSLPALSNATSELQRREAATVVQTQAAELTKAASESASVLADAYQSLPKAPVISMPSRQELEMQPDSIKALTFLPGAGGEGPMLASGCVGSSRAGRLTLFKGDGTVLKQFDSDTARIRLSPDGEWLAALPWGSYLFSTYQRSSGWEKQDHQGTQGRNGSDLIFASNNRLFMGWGSGIQMWKWEQPAPTAPFWQDNQTLSDAVTSFALSPDGRLLVAGADDCHVAVFELSSDPQQPPKLWRNESVRSPLRGVSFSGDGQWLLAPNGGTKLYLFPTQKADSPAVTVRNTGNVIAAKFSQDSLWLAAIGLDRRVTFWQMPDDPTKELKLISSASAHEETPRVMAWSKKENLLATAGDDAVIYLWRPQKDTPGTLVPEGALRGHTKRIDVLEFNEDGSLLASGGLDGAVNLWDFQKSVIWQQGTFDSFGGPDDPKQKDDSTLALINNWQQAGQTKVKVFKGKPTSQGPFAKQLDPLSYYIAMRWDYSQTSKSDLLTKTVQVMNPRTGQIIEAQPVDYGPSPSTGHLTHLSPGLISALKLSAGDLVAIRSIP